MKRSGILKHFEQSCICHNNYRSSISSINTSESLTNGGVITQLCQQLSTCEGKLRELEQLNGITQRWSVVSTQYREVKALVTSENRTCLLLKLEQTARERWFLSTLKAKYAGTYECDDCIFSI